MDQQNATTRVPCADYRPLREWLWPQAYLRFEDISNDLRYTDCECGATWRQHHPNA